MVHIFLLNLRRFLANDLLSWLGDDRVLDSVIDRRSFDFLWAAVARDGIFCSRLFFSFEVVIFL